jgi:hypothetical protein
MSFLDKCRTCGQEIQVEKDESRASRGYMEGAVIPAYCEWQYNIPTRSKGYDEARRYLFKRDFNYEVVENRQGSPSRIPVSTRGKAKLVLDVFTRYAEENGCPIPNVELYKTYKEKYSMDNRFPTFHDFLDFLGLQVDSMPSKQSLEDVLNPDPIDYPVDSDEITAF